MSLAHEKRSIRSLRQVAFAVALILGIKVLAAILAEYRWYFPADFKQSTFLTGREPLFRDWYRAVFYVHLVCAPCALLLFAGLWLSSKYSFLASHNKAWRAGSRVWHRRAGKVAVAIVVLGVVPSGLGMSWHALMGPIAGWGFAIQSLLTGVTATATAVTARRKEFAAHQRWSARCTILLVAPLFLRLIAGFASTVDWDYDWIYRLNAWCSWSVPLFAFEVYTAVRMGRPSTNYQLVNTQGTTMRHHNRRWLPGQSIRRRAITLIEVGVVLGIVLLLGALLLPIHRSAPEAARRVNCSNNLRLLLLASLNYESAHGVLPAASGGTGGDTDPFTSNLMRLSGRVALLPFLEKQALWDDIIGTLEVDGRAYPPMGPAPWITDYPPWKTHISQLQCPSNPYDSSDRGTTSYAFCIGDLARDIHSLTPQRGPFAYGAFTRLTEVTDGTTHTIGLSEIGNGRPTTRNTNGNVAVQPASILEKPSDCFRVAGQGKYLVDGVQVGEAQRGEWWADGSAGVGLFNTILPPNSPSCAVGSSPASDGIFAAASHHSGGNVMVAMLDGHIRPIDSHIDVGDSDHPALRPEQAAETPVQSPYGVWGALGTIKGHEPTDDE